jgi:PPOX class probable F420-dependent enzyme
MATLGEKERRFIDENPFVGVVTTLRPDGSPHPTVVWVDTEDGAASFNTIRGRAKERHLKADPRVSLLVLDPQNPFRWVAVSGRARLVDESADAQIDKLAKKYIGKDEYPWRQPDQQRVKVLIEPENVESTGLD